MRKEPPFCNAKWGRYHKYHMRFRQWVEDIELQQTVPPPEWSKKIYVSDPNNPQQVAAWQRHETKRTFRFPLAKDKFVHFTLADSAKEIVKAGVLRSPVFAVSLAWGTFLPVVQYNHIISKTNSKVIDPSILRNKYNVEKLQKRGWRIPNLGQEIAAIIFRTNINPGRANKEEVIWDVDIPLQDAQIMSSRDAIRLLKNTPYGPQVGNDDVVEYY